MYEDQAVHRSKWNRGGFGPKARAVSRPVRARDLPLPRQLFGAVFLGLRARQRCHEGNEIIDLLLGQSEGLDVFVSSR
jgi:hypothetical protein